MKIFRKCFYCNEYSLEPNSMDLINKVYGLDDILNNPQKAKDYKLPKVDLNDLNAIFSKYAIEKLTQKCSFCSHPLRATYTPEDALEYAYKTYDEFYEFMGGINLPKEIIIKIVEGKLSYKGKYEYDEQLKMFVVKVHMSEITHFNQFRAILFHEFTHLMDDYDPSTGKKKAVRRGKATIVASIPKFYTEIHAKYIELMALLNFKSVKEKRKVSLMSKIPYEGKIITLKEYIDKAVKGFGNKIVKRCNMENAFENNNDIIEVTRSISYFRGIIIFCKNYLDERALSLIPNASELENLVKNKFPDDYDDFTELFNILEEHLSKSLNDVDDSLIDEVMTKILSLILINTPKSRHEKADFKKILQHNIYIYKNWDKMKGLRGLIK